MRKFLHCFNTFLNFKTMINTSIVLESQIVASATTIRAIYEIIARQIRKTQNKPAFVVDVYAAEFTGLLSKQPSIQVSCNRYKVVNIDELHGLGLCADLFGNEATDFVTAELEQIESW